MLHVDSPRELALDDQRIPIDRLFEIQDNVALRHSQANESALTFVKQCMESCLNRNLYVTPSDTCDKVSLQVFEHLFSEVSASLLNSYRVALWGAIPDSYAILRVALEGIEFISQLSQDNDFGTILIDMRSGKLKISKSMKPHKHDQSAREAIGRLSNIASHFTEQRIGQRRHMVDGKIYSGKPWSYYEDTDDLSKRLSYLINVNLYAVRVLRDYSQKYHSNCMSQGFFDECDGLEVRYTEITRLLS